MSTSISILSRVVPILLLGTTAAADTIIVPDDHPTIRQAVAAASDGDSIIVRAGTYPEGPLTYGNKSLVIHAESGPDVTTITMGGNSGGTVVSIRGVQDWAILSGFHITGGDSPAHGGGLDVRGTSPDPDDFINVQVENCLFTGNSAEAFGGGVYAARNTSVYMYLCTLRSNFAGESGGGAYLDCDASTHVEHCLFEGNFAGQTGGGLKIGGESIPSKDSRYFADNCIFSGNIAWTAGGGLLATPSSLKATEFCGAVNCTFSGNIAPTDPAVTSRSLGKPAAPAIVLNSILSNNVGAQQIRGVAFEFEFAPPTQFEHCLIDTLPTDAEVSAYDLVAGIAGFVDEFGTDGVSGTGDENLRLTPLSVAIDAGMEPTLTPIDSLDVYGDPRRVDDPLVAPSGDPGPLDLGAAEYDIDSVGGSLAIWASPGQSNVPLLNQAHWYDGVLPIDGPTGLVRMPGAQSLATVDAFDLVGDLTFDGGRMTVIPADGSPSLVGLYFREGGSYRGIAKVTERPGEASALRVYDMRFQASFLTIEGGDAEFYNSAVSIRDGAISIHPSAQLTLKLGSSIVNGLVTPPAVNNHGLLTVDEVVLDGNYSQNSTDTGEVITPAGSLATTIGAADDSTSNPRLDVTGDVRLGGTLAVKSDGSGSPPTGTQVPMLRAETITESFELLHASGFPDTVGFHLTIVDSAQGGSSQVVIEVVDAGDTVFGEISFESIWPDGIEDSLLADVDNDGDSDLIVSLATEPGESFSYVGFLANQGSSGGSWIGFETLQVGVNTVQISGSVNGLAVGDLDDDGLIDVVVANKDAGTIHVLENRSNVPDQLVFVDVLDVESSPDLPPGTAQPNSTWIGDLDADARPDVVVNNETDGSVVVFKNISTFAFGLGSGSSSIPLKKMKRISPTGTGTDREEKPFGVGSNQSNSSGSETEGESDDDDDDDSSGNVQVGKTTLTVGGTIRMEWDEFAVGEDPVDAEAGDLNDDGQRDIVTANRAGESVSILLASGLETFDPALTIPIGAPCESIDLGDLDGDGDLDIAVLVATNSTSSSVRVLRNDSDISGVTSFTLESDSLFEGDDVNRINIGSLDEDANDDIVVMAVTPTLQGSKFGWRATLAGVGSDCLGDIDRDDHVGPIDLAFLLGAWGPASATEPSDFNGDLRVDGADLLVVLNEWGGCDSDALED